MSNLGDFQIGDKVRCVKNINLSHLDELVLNQLYTIKRIGLFGIVLEEKYPKNSMILPYKYNASRFVKCSIAEFYEWETVEILNNP